MRLLTLNLSCENVKYPARKHFEKTNIRMKVACFSRLYSACIHSLTTMKRGLLVQMDEKCKIFCG